MGLGDGMGSGNGMGPGTEREEAIQQVLATLHTCSTKIMFSFLAEGTH